MLFVFSILFSSCENNPIKQPKNQTIRIRLNYILNNYNATKASAFDNKLISDINIFIYNRDGNLINSYFQNGCISSIDLSSISSSNGFYIYVLANVGNIKKSSIPINLNALRLYKYRITDSIKSLVTSTPMCYSSGLIHLTDNSPINIGLTRLLSCITIKIDTTQLSSDITEFNIKKISLHNIPKYISPFSEYHPSNVDDITYNGDSINIVENINTNEFKLYTIENLQGNLLPNNTEENYKSFDQNDIHRKLCTYIEINARYKSKTKEDNNLIYRIYPGENETSNFDIKRNTNYYTVIKPINSGTENIDKFNWKIDLSDMIYYVNQINLSPKNVSISELDSITLHTNIKPKYAKDTIITFSSSNNKIATVDNNGNVSALHHGDCYIIAKSNNGIEEQCHVIVNKLHPTFQIDWGKDTIYRMEIRTARIIKLIPSSAKITWNITNSGNTQHNFSNAPYEQRSVTNNNHNYIFYSTLIYSNIDVTLSCKIESEYLPEGSETLSHVYHYQQLHNTIDDKFNDVIRIYRGEIIDIPVTLYPNNIGQDISAFDYFEIDGTSNLIKTINPEDTSDVFILGNNFVTENNEYRNTKVEINSGIPHNDNNIFMRLRIKDGGNFFNQQETNFVNIKVVEPRISTYDNTIINLYVGDTIDISNRIIYYPSSASQIGLEIRNDNDYVKLVNNKLIGLKTSNGKTITIPIYFKDHTVILENNSYNFHYPEIPNIDNADNYNYIKIYVKVNIKKRDS